jgi:hypothetical protein
MFIFDVETLGKESTAVRLSMALIYFDPDKSPSHKEMFENAFFVKLDAEDQMTRLGRGVTKSSLEWWAKQCHNVKIASFKPSANDVKVEEGLEMMKQYAQKFPDYKNCTVWARGNLDQLVLDSIEEKLGIEPIFHYSKWRDVRTAVDFLTGSNNGYCGVDYEGFDPALDITKHNPIDDCVYDAMMLLYGKKEN